MPLFIRILELDAFPFIKYYVICLFSSLPSLSQFISHLKILMQRAKLVKRKFQTFLITNGACSNEIFVSEIISNILRSGAV